MSGRAVFRPRPTLPASAMKTFQISSPIATHYRPANCAEAECLAYLHGWQTSCDESTDLGAKQAHYVRHDRTRSAVETRSEIGITIFTFAAGQRCFAADSHRVPLGRTELFVVREGDWRGNPRGIEPRIHRSGDDWVDEFANHQDRLATAVSQG